MSGPAFLPLSGAFLGRLAEVRHLAYALFRETSPKAALAGTPSEFDGHRLYMPGDDTRWIDWNIYARLEELYVKVFQVEEEIDVVLMVDGSLSMTSGSGVKYGLAAAAAASMAYLAFLTSHAVTVVKYGEGMLETEGPYRHIRLFPSLSAGLMEVPKGEGTDLGASISPFVHGRIRPATFVVFTDGLQREPLDHVVRLVKETGRHQLVFVIVEDQAERRPPLMGNLQVRDLEGTSTCHVLSERPLERQLHRRIDEYFRQLEKSVTRLGMRLYSLPVERPFEKSMQGILLASNHNLLRRVRQ
jgi:uncharacterized protein (DUF58 family)